MEPTLPTARLLCSCSSSVLAVTARIGVRGLGRLAGADAAGELEAVHGRRPVATQVVTARAPQFEHLLTTLMRNGSWRRPARAAAPKYCDLPNYRRPPGRGR